MPVLYGGNLLARIDRAVTPLQTALPFAGGAGLLWLAAVVALVVQGKLSPSLPRR